MRLWLRLWLRCLVLSVGLVLTSGWALADGITARSKIAAPQQASPAWSSYAAPAEVATWSGGFGGISVSWLEPGEAGGDAISAGGQLGYNWQSSGNLVFGVIGEANYNFDESESSPFEWSGSVRARAGLAFTGFMPFITGGVGYQVVNVAGEAEWALPLVYGAGVEIKGTERVSTRLEYLRYEGDLTDDNFGRDQSVVQLTMSYKF